MNKNYGKLIDSRIEYAPEQVQVGGIVYSKPTAEQYLAAGWKTVHDVTPPYREGYKPVRTGWTGDETTVTAAYEYAEDVPVKADFDISKLKLHMALAQVSLWEPVKAWMSQMTVPLSGGEPVNCYDAYIEAQVLNTGNEMFEPYLAMAKEQFKDYISPEQVDSIISACRAD